MRQKSGGKEEKKWDGSMHEGGREGEGRGPRK
jgi:hypothetical protein